MNSDQRSAMDDRAERLSRVIGETDILLSESLAGQPELIQRPWMAVVSSRLGHNPVLHRDVCRQLSRAMKEYRCRDAVLLIARESAIEPWAKRAAELFDVAVIELLVEDAAAVAKGLSLKITSTTGETVSRDWATILLADRVDAIYVRHQGNVADALHVRLQNDRNASTYVAVTTFPHCAGKELVQAGAVGMLTLHDSTEQNEMSDVSNSLFVGGDETDWMHCNNEWLVHCTRACSGPWPGQTEHQYRDEMLLGEDPSLRTPIDTLRRILRSRRLIANSVATAKAFPVVCLSAVPLAQLLVSRSYRPHLHRWDYEPWGVAIRKKAAIDVGVQQVIYGEKKQRSMIDAASQFRFQTAGKTYDWTKEKEWRSSADIDLNALDSSDVRVFVPNEKDAQAIQQHCPWQISIVIQARPKPS